MNASTKKIASLLTTLGACLSLGSFGTGCILVDGGPAPSGTVVVTNDPGVPDPTPVEPAPAPIADINIDADATLSASPGDGVGVFVQYTGGGHWDVFTTCDTYVTGASCNFDVLISADPGVALWNVEGADLYATDRLALNSDGTIQLVTDTDYGMNGLSFDADPGATIELDVLLDGVAQPRYVFAVSDGLLLEGVPTNPVDFTPSGF